jgi:hypothetical protein
MTLGTSVPGVSFTEPAAPPRVLQDVTQYRTFEEILSSQLQRAPYLIASLLVHVLIGFVLASLMLLQREATLVPSMMVQAAATPEPVPPPQDPPLPLDPEPTLDPEPVTTPSDLVEADPSAWEAVGDPELTAVSPFENLFTNFAIGIGSDAGGQKGGPPGGGRPRGPEMEAALADALGWLAIHQNRAGYWDADEFMLEDRWPQQPPSDGRGNPVVDVGLTGLALLAFLGNGNTLGGGPYRDHVGRAVEWLLSVQRDDGLYGEEVGNSTLYNHAIATLAMSETYRLNARPPPLRPSVQQAAGLLMRARNPYGAWRYTLEPNGDNDTSVTGWIVFALKSAQDAGIAVDKSCFDGAAAWFDSMTDAHTGRTGYAMGEAGGGPGSYSARPHNEARFPPEKSESLTAVALLCRIFMTDTAQVRRWEDHPDYASLARQLDLLRAKPPHWDGLGGGTDFYYWYYATYALNQWGGQAWRDWERALGKALLPVQRRADPQDNFFGSWDPLDAWGEEGGRVYSTAMCALMMEVYYRYTRVLGQR